MKFSINRSQQAFVVFYYTELSLRTVYYPQSASRPKVQLVAGHEVYITKSELSALSCRTQLSKNPSLVTKQLLDIFFSREIFSASCAKGARNAVNKKHESTTTPLPAPVLAAIYG